MFFQPGLPFNVNHPAQIKKIKGQMKKAAKQMGLSQPPTDEIAVKA